MAYAGQYCPQAYTLFGRRVNYRVTCKLSFDFIAHKRKWVSLSVPWRPSEEAFHPHFAKRHKGGGDWKECLPVSRLTLSTTASCLSNFKVTLSPAIEKPEPQVNIFERKSGVPYRIPAIATPHNGDIIRRGRLSP